ncbi:HlyD family efflux transporter periplasmic adaptor subunit [Kitasatospora sp. LaBMicrA B282]|uniref:HlyD family efflux transporter periplasmic adaptor subunit n=1 Tax=Kitasatospora sp. LaBMicrA B282 TaxID=3420949 RepID=UPI003D0E69CA
MKFRFKALQRMREPDELDSPTLLAAPRGWIALFVVLITMTAALLWTFAGHIPITVDAPGLLTHPNGTALIQSPYGGMVRSVLTQPADQVALGQTVVEVEDAQGHTQQVTSPFGGQVVGLSVTAGQVVEPGTPIASVERTDASPDRMVAMVFVPAPQAIGLAPGEQVDLSVSTAPSSAFGLLRGTITSISPYTLTKDAVSGLVGGDLAAQRYLTGAPPRLVLIDLVRDPATRTGYAWTSQSGPPMPLGSQVSVTATVDVGRQTPFNLILGR